MFDTGIRQTKDTALRPLLRRAVATSALVGTALLVINQWEALRSGNLPDSLWWRGPLTYLIPFAVSLHAARGAQRT